MASVANGFSIVIIPDTQIITKNHPEKLQAMADLIVDQAERLNLQMVLHLGDVVHNGAADEVQFRNAREALARIDQANIPMLIAPGNHDYDNMLKEDRSLSMFNRYFGVERYTDKAWFGGAYEEGKAENVFASLEAEGKKLLFICLEFGPRDEVLAWADQVLQQHHDHDAIIITHCFMYLYGERSKPGDKHNPKDYPGADGANDGEDIWQKSLKKHKNVAAVFSGHQIPDNVSYKMDMGDHGNVVFQSFQNWQSSENGGEGRFRIMTYQPAENRVTLTVCHPLTGQPEEKEGYQVSYSLEADYAKQEMLRYPAVQHI